MKVCDSFIKWQSPPRKLAKEVFVEFLPAKEKNSFAKEWRKVLAKDHVIRIESHEVFNTAELKEPHRTTKVYSQMNADWKVYKAHYAECNVPRTVMMGLNWICLDQCHCVRSHGKSSSQDWRKIVVQSKFDPWVHILVFAKGDICRFACKSLLTEEGLCRHQFFSVVAQGTAKIRPRQPKGNFQLKELHRTTKAYSQMNADWKLEKAQYAEFSAQTCDKIAVWPLCRERKPVRNSYDGPNYIRVLLTWFMQVCLGKPSHKNRQRWTLDISVFLWFRKIRPRPAQGLFPIERTSYKNYKVFSQMNADWKVDKAQ